MADAPDLPAAPGFAPDADAWSRYGDLVESTIRTVSEAAAALAPDLDPRPMAPPEPVAPGPRAGYGDRGWGDLADLVTRLSAGEVRPSELAEASIAAVERHDGTLKAVVALEAERAREEARHLDATDPADRGPLAGAPYARKDLFYRAGEPAPCGAKVLEGHVPDTSASVIEWLDAAGGIDMGRLAMAELAMSPTGFNAHEPHPRNPWNTDHVPGGSSSGSGVAVAAGYVPFALGTDTGGSVRHPAAACGLTGLKPTRGRVSRAGAWPLAWTLDSIGPLARTARDCALVMEVIARPDQRDPTVPASANFIAPSLEGDLSGVRIAVPGGYYAAETTPAVAAGLAAVRRTLEDLGAVTVDTTPPDMGLTNTLAHVVLAVEASAQLRLHLVSSDCPIGRQVRDRVEPGLFYPASHYANALRYIAPLRAGWLSATMAGADAVLMPTLPREVPTIAETTGPDLAGTAAVIGHLTRATRAINYLGLPALSAPCGFDANGCPLAFQLVGRPFDEALLLRIADTFQRATDWHLKRPFDA